MKPFILAGNWKLNKTARDTEAFLQQLTTKLKAEDLKKMVIFPPASNLFVFQKVFGGANSLSYGLQNVHSELEGAFTGENSVKSVVEMGGQYVLVGHSERRQLFHEKDEDLAKKINLVQDHGLTPMLCLGETFEQRESDQTFEVVFYQLQKCLTQFDPRKPLVIAYEPVWAIGTGKVATPEIAEEVHRQIRSELKEMFSEQMARSTPILYGGSVKASNAKQLISKDNIDGFLVGGASLNCEDFIQIYQQCL